MCFDPSFLCLKIKAKVAGYQTESLLQAPAFRLSGCAKHVQNSSRRFCRVWRVEVRRI